MNFGSPQIYAATTVRSLWPLETKSTAGAAESWIYGPHKRFQVTNQQQSPPTSFNGGDKRFFFLQKNDTKQGNQTYPEAFLCHPFEPPGKGRERQNHHIMSSDEITLPIDSGGRALYLLSTNPTQFSGLNQLGQSTESFPYPFQLLNYDIGKNKPVDPDLPVYDINKTNIYGNMMLRMGPDDLLERGAALHMLPISLD